MAALPQGCKWKQADEEDLTEIRNCRCPACGSGNATTLLLPTQVPMFREIIIMALSCEDCNFRNSEVSFGGEIQERGERVTLTVTSPTDFNRQIIKSDSASIHIPSLQFEIPPMTQRGTISTLEGVLERAVENLQEGQAKRFQLADFDNFHRCQSVIDQLKIMYSNDTNSGEELDCGSKENTELHHDNKINNKNGVPSFTIIVDDPAGNSFIENFMAPRTDPALSSEKYYRTPTQDMALGLQPSKAAWEDGTIDDAVIAHKNLVNSAESIMGKHSIAEVAGGDSSARPSTIAKKEAILVDVASDETAIPLNENDTEEDKLGSVGIGRKEVVKFPTPCPNCKIIAETSMCVTDIPHFKECIIMSLFCESCGYKSNEIKGGGGIPEYGTKITLSVFSNDDMAREVLKSDTAGIIIPEIEMELQEGGLDGMYSTVEGLMKKLFTRLEKANPFGHGDSASKQHLTNDPQVTPGFSAMKEDHVKYAEFLQKLKNMADGISLPFTIVITDPLSNSFVGPVPSDAIALAKQAEEEGSHDCYQSYDDSGMQIEEYERSYEVNDDLGLNDIKTENYQQDKNEDGNDHHEGKDIEKAVNYGTDKMSSLPDRLRKLEIRGVDHPHMVAKAPVEGDTTVMGPNSANFAVPGMEKRGNRYQQKK